MSAILIRHAETDGNRTRFVGREDLSLNAKGRMQAAQLARELQATRIDLLLSSPLMRAIQTATAIACVRAIDIVSRPALMEIDFGHLQGAPKAAQRVSLRQRYRTDPIPGGESLRQVWQRLDPVAAEIVAAVRAGQTVVVVGHYWSNRLLRDKLAGLPFERCLSDGDYKPRNASAHVMPWCAATVVENMTSVER